MRYSSYTTQLIPNAYSGEIHKTSHVGLSGPLIFLAQSGLAVTRWVLLTLEVMRVVVLDRWC